MQMYDGIQHYNFIKLSIKWMARNFEQFFHFALYHTLWGDKKIFH